MRRGSVEDPAETHRELHTERVAIFSHITAVKVKGKTGTQLSDLVPPPVTLRLVPSELCYESLSVDSLTTRSTFDVAEEYFRTCCICIHQ